MPADSSNRASIDDAPRPTIADRPRDEGSAIILVLMVLMLATALAATLGAVTISNLQGARRSTASTTVLNAAEAGLSQAVTFMRQNGVAGLRCNHTGTDPATGWSSECSSAYGRGNTVAPAGAAAGGARYSTWVEEVKRFSSRSSAEGVYLVHSVGLTTNQRPATCQSIAGACRSITAKVIVTNFGLGTGIYSKSVRGNSNGNATITDQSIFTTGCFPKRAGSFLVQGFDEAHGIPAGVHTSGIITDGPESKCSSVSNSIHASGPCNTTYPFDQDSQGGSLAATSCATLIASATPGGVANSAVYGAANPAATDPVFGSKITSQQGMQDTFGLPYPPLSDDQVERLRAIAQEDLTYKVTNVWPSPATAAASRGVFFFDLSGKTGNQAAVDLAAVPDPFNKESGVCSGAVIVIKNGNAAISPSNASAKVGASVYLLGGGGTGIATLNGGRLYGGLFAESIDFSGNPELKPASCSDDSANPALLTIRVTSYSEDD